MENLIFHLLKGYEQGAFTRRELVKRLLALTVATGATSASANGFQATSIDHVSVVVSDVQRSAEFYGRVFALSVLNKEPTGDTIRMKLGSSYLALRKRKMVHSTWLFAFGVANFNEKLVTQDLVRRGAAPQEEEDAGFHVKDPDGFRVQIISTDPRVRPDRRQY